MTDWRIATLNLIMSEGKDVGEIPETPGIERAMQRDRAFFASNPKRDWYIRLKIPGEWGDAPIGPEYTHVKVIRMGPGWRIRIPLRLSD